MCIRDSVPTSPEVSDPQSYPHILPDDKIVVDETPPTVEEVKSAISKLKNGKATGTDGLTAELLKYNDCFELPHFLVDVWNGGDVSSSWKHSG